MSEWREMALGDFVSLQRGHDLTDNQRRPGQIPVMGSAGMNGYHDTALARGPGVVVGRSGASFGKVHYCRQDYWPHNTALYVTDFRGNDTRFTYYFLKSLDFTRYNSGSAQASLNRNYIYPLRVCIPSLPEQRGIAHILGTLDDKIELNRRMNQTLEAMAQALFKSWFVDPTRDGLPNGWRAGTVSDLATIGRESLNPGQYSEETFDHYSIPAFDEGRTPKPETGETIKSNKFIVQPGCVMMSKLNPRIPRIWLPDLDGRNRAVCSTELLVMTPRPGVSRYFLYCLFNDESFVTTFATMVTGTSGSHQRVKPESLLNMEVALPPPSLVQSFAEIAAPPLDRINHNTRESRTLAQLRDTLLPKLLSGELRVAA